MAASPVFADGRQVVERRNANRFDPVSRDEAHWSDHGLPIAGLGGALLRSARLGEPRQTLNTPNHALALSPSFACFACFAVLSPHRLGPQPPRITPTSFDLERRPNPLTLAVVEALRRKAQVLRKASH